MTNYLMVLGGDPKLWPVIQPFISSGYRLVGVDRGAIYILERGFDLWMAVGDFDSVSQSERQLIANQAKFIHYSIPEKDDTDTELALKQVFQQDEQAIVTLIGATGGRLDHFLSNLWLPLEQRFSKYARQIRLVDCQNTIEYYYPGKYTVKKADNKKYLGYICLTPVTGLSLYGSKYLLDQIDTTIPFSFASNEFLTETAQFEFKTGVMAVIQSCDLTLFR